MENSCNRTNCLCSHDNGCVKGFIEIRYKTVEKRLYKGEEITIENWYEGVKFCEVCDPERARIQQTALSAQDMAEKLKSRTPLKQAENYKKEIESKTRTL